MTKAFSLKGIQYSIHYAENPLGKIIVMCGISGSGKTTFAKTLCKLGALRVSRDDLRYMLFGLDDKGYKEYFLKPDLYRRENFITEIEDRCIMEALLMNTPVVIDSTNLKPSYVERYKKFGFPIEIAVFDTDLDTCIERDMARDRIVGGDVIAKQQEKFRGFIKLMETSDYYKLTHTAFIK